ncbi:endonuclease/exonuclease/phosphatase family protein [Psychroflexus montanilacus]|uniref:endonuclease/exonuclease/phosphatase family protein n=1 Tax=Psychroflexus montanilacus TaxID=2873598 RepID=UPI001CC9EC6D|nr:endonuclease/exonuclease/phosphatase family protein [Psychroflexus montanilacus]MBZ9652644.1 endonuclease/exonuclease/phosphatase family protein [Psychroflexus montanilacus]
MIQTLKFQTFLLGFLFLIAGCSSTEKASNKSSKTDEFLINTIAFYNLENLFDTEDDPDKFDEASPIMEMAEGEREEVYKKKVANMAKVIADIGSDVTGMPAAVIGVCEIENFQVLQDVVNDKRLSPYNYGIIHYNSPDARSIDVALLYQKRVFQPTHSKAHELVLYDKDDRNKRKYTRDQLHVKGKLDGEEMHFIVNHWPSRSGGEKRSRPNRVNAAKLTKKLQDSIQMEEPYAKIMIMGDFNDGPYNESIKEVLNAKEYSDDLGITDIYNPFEKLHKKGVGTIAWRDTWDLFDMIMVTKPLVNKKDYNSYTLYQANIFNPYYLQNPKGRYKGYPYRSFADGGFTGGYSDHFPVYLYLIKKKSAKTEVSSSN